MGSLSRVQMYYLDLEKFIEENTLPTFGALLNGQSIYKTEFGSIYLGLSMTVLPLFVVYFMLSKYIIAGVALGGVKE